MSQYTDYNDYMYRRVKKLNCCCEKGDQGTAGIDGVDGTGKHCDPAQCVAED